MSSRLKEIYKEKICKELLTELDYKNIMEVPKLSKIVLNVGVKEAVADSKVLGGIKELISAVAGQASVITKAKKSIAGFKVRTGMPLGVMVTLRGDNMYNFLDKLINISLPRVRDFQGVNTKFDGRGNYNLGIKDWLIFPEIDYEKVDKIRGINITIETTAKNDKEALALLKNFGMPFRAS